jgi:hypothetical protein
MGLGIGLARKSLRLNLDWKKKAAPRGFVSHGKKVRSFAVVADGFNRAAFKGLHAKLNIFLGRWLGVNEGISTLFVPLEKGRRSFAAKITIDALLINVELPRSVVPPFFCFVGH